MLFSSMLFLWIFLPFTIIGNFILTVIRFKNPQTRIKLKNIFLLIMSCIFYMWGGINYFFIMVLVILINYAGGLLLHKFDSDPRKRKLWLTVTVLLNLAVLFYFKYFNFFVSMLESIVRLDFGLKEVALPIGISFFVFQSMSYTIDAYRRQVRVQRNLINLALYVSLFPQLIAGPIVRYIDVEKELQDRHETLADFALGVRRFCYGLGKKVLFANTFAVVADKIFDGQIVGMGAAVAWMGVIMYALQIYYDFSGYSDMAIGLGKMFGFHFLENFNYPYTSLSVREFWRRWHISLSTWFREYVYIPLGGNRKGKARTYLNLFIVFLVTGIWHGAAYTFVLWGIYFGIFMVAERLFLGKWLDKNPVKPVNWIYTQLVVLFGWVMFRAKDVPTALSYVKEMFSPCTNGDMIWNYLSLYTCVAFVAAVLACGFVQRGLRKLLDRFKVTNCAYVLETCLEAGIIVSSVFMLASGSYNPFIYFQF